jgi:fibro-slime domain-containing protein
MCTVKQGFRFKPGGWENTMHNNFMMVRTSLSVACATSLFCTAGALASESGNTSEEDPESVVLTGIIRDFNEKTAENGHPDFENRPSSGFGHYVGNIGLQLNEEGKPVFTGNGRKLKRDFKDSSGNPICWSVYDPEMGDSNGRLTVQDQGGINSSNSFDSWFNDVLGINLSRTLDLRLDRQNDGSYVFDSDEAEWCRDAGGFFPIENQLLGNPPASGNSPDKNFHFTFELQTEFTYDENGAQVFTFRGDDDVWVFINDELVIDVGGVHNAIKQTISLDRLGLEDGGIYRLSFFFAERHRTESNFRIQTNLKLETVNLPTVTAAYD